MTEQQAPPARSPRPPRWFWAFVGGGAALMVALPLLLGYGEQQSAPQQPAALPSPATQRVLGLIGGTLDGEAAFISAQPISNGLKNYSWGTGGPGNTSADLWASPGQRDEVFFLSLENYRGSLEELASGRLEQVDANPARTWYCIRSGPLTGVRLEYLHPEGDEPHARLMSPDYLEQHFPDGGVRCL